MLFLEIGQELHSQAFEKMGQRSILWPAFVFVLSLIFGLLLSFTFAFALSPNEVFVLHHCSELLRGFCVLLLIAFVLTIVAFLRHEIFRGTFDSPWGSAFGEVEEKACQK